MKRPENLWLVAVSYSEFISSTDLSVFSLKTMMVKIALLTRITKQATLDD